MNPSYATIDNYNTIYDYIEPPFQDRLIVLESVLQLSNQSFCAFILVHSPKKNILNLYFYNVFNLISCDLYEFDPVSNKKLFLTHLWYNHDKKKILSTNIQIFPSISFDDNLLSKIITNKIFIYLQFNKHPDVFALLSLTHDDFL